MVRLLMQHGANARQGVYPHNEATTPFTIAVERGYLSRTEAINRTLTKLRFFYYGPDGEGPDAIGHKGFYYYFLDM